MSSDLGQEKNDPTPSAIKKESSASTLSLSIPLSSSDHELSIPEAKEDDNNPLQQNLIDLHTNPSSITWFDDFKRYSFFIIIGLLGFFGAYAFWSTTVLVSLPTSISNIGGLSMGGVFFLANAVLMGFATYQAIKSYRAAKKIEDDKWKFRGINFFYVVGLVGMLIGANYFAWANYIDFGHITQLKKPLHNATDITFIATTAVLSLVYFLFALYQVYMKSHLRTEEQKNLLKSKKNADHSFIDEDELLRIGSGLNPDNDEEQLQECWETIIRTSSSDDEQEEQKHIKAVYSKKYTRSHKWYLAGLLGILNGFISGVNGFSFAKGALFTGNNLESTMARYGFALFSAILGAIFFSRDFNSTAKEYHHALQQYDNILVLQKNNDLENIYAILNDRFEHGNKMSGTAERQKLLKAIHNFLEKSNVQEKIKQKQKNESKAPFNIITFLVVVAFLSTSVGTFYSIIEADNLPKGWKYALLTVTALGVLWGGYLQYHTLHLLNKNVARELPEKYYKLEKDIIEELQNSNNSVGNNKSYRPSDNSNSDIKQNDSDEDENNALQNSIQSCISQN